MLSIYTHSFSVKHYGSHTSLNPKTCRLQLILLQNACNPVHLISLPFTHWLQAAAFEPLGPEDGVVPHTPVLEGKQLPMGSQIQTIPSTPSDPPTSAVPQLAMTMQATGGKEKKKVIPFFSKNLAPLVILHSCQIVLPIFRQKVVTHIYIYYAIEITCSWNVEHLLGKAWALFLCQILSRSSK